MFKYSSSSKISQLKELLLLLGILFLPVYQTINHWFFGLFLILSLSEFFLKRENAINLKRFGKFFLISCAIFFVLRAVFFFHSSNLGISQKELTRALPFLLYPLGILTLSNQGMNYKTFEKRILFALTIGCLISAAICWGNVLLNMENNAIPAEKFFGWKKSGIYLTTILDVHPPYLGMMLFGSIVFLFREVVYEEKLNSLKKVVYVLSLAVLLVFLFNITARNSLLFLFFVGFIYFIYKKYWKLVLISIAVIISAAVLIINHPSQYYRIKLYHMLGFSQDDTYTDKRFQRLKASYKVFLEKPIYGVGLGRDSELKTTYYYQMGDEIAAKAKFNSHNQFFEYLAAYGIIGGISLVVAFSTLIFVLVKHKFYFLLLLFLNIVLASLTESIFERALGIQYFSVIFSLILLKIIYNKNVVKLQ